MAFFFHLKKLFAGIAMLTKNFKHYFFIAAFLSVVLLIIYQVRNSLSDSFANKGNDKTDFNSQVFASTQIANQKYPTSISIPTPSTKIDDAPITHLNIKLSGIIAENNEFNSASAIIIIGKEQKKFLNNAILYKGVRLVKIMRDHVILSNEGRYESLWLYDSNSSAVEETPQKSEASTEVSKETPIIYGRIPGPNEPAAYTPNRQYEEASLLAINGPFNGFITLDIQRNSSNDELIGYRINASQNEEKFKKSGLQNIDIITAINGIPLTKPEEILESYKNIVDGKILLEVERNGATANVELDMK